MELIKDQLPPEKYNKLVDENIDSLFALLTTSSQELQNITELPEENINELKNLVSTLTIKDKFLTADQVLPWVRISTGCKNIDSILKGGIPVNGISEIVGTSGCGKTQICMQLALQLQISKEKETLYICTEDPFPSKRLAQLAKNLNDKHGTNINFEDHIFVEHSADFEQLRKCILVRLPSFLHRRNIGLLIIDSIAGVFRSENENVNYSNRSKEFMTLGAALHELTEKHHIAVVCVNQVVDNLETETSEPCLGLAWSNLVTCRFKVTRYNETTVRKFEVAFAPDLPDSYCNFVINEEGICDYE